jgi:hypothetical protein
VPVVKAGRITDESQEFLGEKEKWGKKTPHSRQVKRGASSIHSDSE